MTLLSQWIEDDYRRLQQAQKEGRPHPEPDWDFITVGEPILTNPSLEGILFESERWIDRVARGEGCA